MAGIAGLVQSYRMSANKRVHKFTAMLADSTDTTGQNAMYAALPTTSNGGQVIGVSIEHFVEPNYFVAQGTDPTTVTGSTPVLYTLTGRPIGLQVNGVARCLAGSAINQGDLLYVLDAYGRVATVTNSAPGGTETLVYPVGTAENSVTTANDVVLVRLEFTPRIFYVS